MQNILELTPEEMAALVEELGEPGFRARQILEWVYTRFETDPAAMTNLSLALREKLAKRVCVFGVVDSVVRSEDGRTAKFLFRLRDGAAIEAVSMKDRGRHTVCISSQVGCAMGCTFCATAGMGFVRDLTAGEMLLQAVALAREEGAINNLVFMGMGEPLLNLPNVLKAVEALADTRRFGLGTRKITVSTCGIAPGIVALTESPVPVRLALSLNSPFDEQRAELMPVARKYRLREVINACGKFSLATGRHVMLEYVLFHDLNGDRKCARALAKIAAELGSKVNLIEYNPAPGAPFEPPQHTETNRFRAWLEEQGVPATIRFRRGRSIAAGCGQLATKSKRHKKRPAPRPGT